MIHETPLPLLEQMHQMAGGHTKDFQALGVALKLTDRQISNSFRRIQKGLNDD